MSRKYIDQILTTGFKYFFDLDYTTLLHSLTVFIVAAGILKLAALWIRNEWHEGVSKVKQDALVIKGHLADMAEKADEKEQLLHDFVKNQFTNLRNVRERLAS